MQRSLRVVPRPLPANVIQKLIAIVAFANVGRELCCALRIFLAPLRGDALQCASPRLTLRKLLRPRDRGLHIISGKLNRQQCHRVVARFSRSHPVHEIFRARRIVTDPRREHIS